MIVCYCLGSNTHHGGPCNTMFTKQNTRFVLTLYLRDFTSCEIRIVISYGIRKPTLSVPETKSRILLDRGRSPRSSKIRDLVEGTERGFLSP